MPVGFPDYYGGLTLPVTVEEGGTGQTTLELNGVLIGQGTTGVAVVAPGAVGDVLQVPSGGGAPVFQALDIDLTTLTGILPIANGGTGETAPSLVAGSNIAITGSWPDETVAVVASPTFTALSIDNATGTSAVTIYGNQASHYDAYISLYDETGAAERGLLLLLSYTGHIFGGTAAGDILLRADTGTLWLGVANTWAIKIDQSTVVTLHDPLAVSSGGTGASSFVAASIWTGVGQADALTQNAGLTGQSLIASASGRRNTVTVGVRIHNASGGSLSVSVGFSWTERSTLMAGSVGPFTLTAVGDEWYGGSFFVYADSGTEVKWSADIGGFGSGDYYDIHLAALGQ